MNKKVKKYFNTLHNKLGYMKKTNLARFFNKRNIIIFLSIVGLFIITYNMFITFNIVVSYDSSKYHNYSEILMGNKALSTWDVERGFSFPLVLYLCRIIFGNCSMVFVKGFFILYFIMLLIVIKVIYDLIKYNNIKKKKIMYYILFLCFFPFNPLIVGWGHSMLTEAIVPCMYFIALYLSIMWFDVEFKMNKFKFISIVFLYSILSSFVWFLKQPYAPTIWAMIGITSIMSAIYFGKFRIFLEKILGLVVVIVINISSIFIWNGILKNAGVNFENARDSSFFLKSNIIEGIYYHVKEVPDDIKCSEKYIKGIKLNKNRKKNIYRLINYNSNWCNHLNIYEVKDSKKKLIAHEYFISDKEEPSLKELIIFVSKLYIRYPKIQFDTLLSGYLSLIDLEKTSHNYKATGIYSEDAIKELGTSFYALSYNKKNTWWKIHENDEEYKYYFNKVTDEWIKPMKKYNGVTSKSKFMSTTMLLLKDTALFTFKVLLLLCFPVGIYSFIMFIRYPKSKCYYIMSLLGFSTFVHLIFHVFMGAIIDRYAYPVYPLMLLCLILMFFQNNDSDKFKKKQVLVDGSSDNNETKTRKNKR